MAFKRSRVRLTLSPPASQLDVMKSSLYVSNDDFSLSVATNKTTEDEPLSFFILCNKWLAPKLPLAVVEGE